MLDLLRLGTFCWMAGWAMLAFYQLAWGRSHSILFVIVVHFLFCGIPLLLDVVIGVPRYAQFPGFGVASSDTATLVVYCAYVGFAPMAWWWIGRSSHPGRQFSVTLAEVQRREQHVWLQAVLIVIALSPAIMLAFAPDRSVYTVYAQPLRAMGEHSAQYHQAITASARLSTLALAALVLIKRRLSLALCVCVAPWWTLNIWLFGKRSAVALSLALILHILWTRGNLRGARLAIAALAGAILLGSFSYHYQAGTGRVSADFGELMYENVRIDYGRDDVIKMTIFAELYPDQMRILEYRGQSLLFYATAWIPREIWPDKPFPYAQYSTSALFFASPTLWGWGMTTSVLEEGIANFGWLGIAVGLMIPVVICRMTDASQSNIARLAGVPVALLFMLMEAIAFAPLIALWLFCIAWASYTSRCGARKWVRAWSIGGLPQGCQQPANVRRSHAVRSLERGHS